MASQRANEALELRDPDAMLAVILDHLKIITGTETDGDKANFLADCTQEKSLQLNEGLMEHFLAVQERANTGGMFLGRLPGEDSAEKRNFVERFNEGLAIKLAVMSLDAGTHVLRRKWEGSVPTATLANLSFEQYAHGLSSFVLNEKMENPAAPKVARIFAATQRRPMRCYNCQELGHKAADCPDANDEDAAISQADLKVLRRILKTSAEPKQTAKVAKVATSASRVAPVAAAAPPVLSSEEDTADELSDE
jgi:Zinc knuckle